MVDESMISLPIGVRLRWRSSSLTKFRCIRFDFLFNSRDRMLFYGLLFGKLCFGGFW